MIKRWVKAEPSISRRELSRRLCGENDPRSPNGDPKEMGCRKDLRNGDLEPIPFSLEGSFSLTHAKLLFPCSG
jgi:hypothetical protein